MNIFAKPFIRTLVVVDRKFVFSKHKMRIERSQLALVTGNVAAILSTVLMFGYMVLTAFSSALGAVLRVVHLRDDHAT